MPPTLRSLSIGQAKTKIRSQKSETKTKLELLNPPYGFEVRVSDFEFNYMSYMLYMVEKAVVLHVYM